jgi:hypothetical protein
MTNNTELEGFSCWAENYRYDFRPFTRRERGIAEAAWQAALAQREQTAPKQDELAESSCTPEEAGFEVTPEDADDWPSVTDGMQEQIDNALDADRAKR